MVETGVASALEDLSRQTSRRFLVDIALVDNRLMFARSPRRGCSFSKSELVVEALDSSARRVLGRYDLRASPQVFLGRTFDYDGKTALFSEGIVPREREKARTSIFSAPAG